MNMCVYQILILNKVFQLRYTDRPYFVEYNTSWTNQNEEMGELREKVKRIKDSMKCITK